ncbi:MAG TPA: hypothetical protein VK464_15295 [Symbiobacteriaceae bacterium]|nr:hypothetical protein [Symbiobacteriaceae bacterium]
MGQHSGGTPKGHTGQEVQSTGTYRAQSGETFTYMVGDKFRPDPVTGKAVTWEKTREPEHPGGSR